MEDKKEQGTWLSQSPQRSQRGRIYLRRIREILILLKNSAFLQANLFVCRALFSASANLRPTNKKLSLCVSVASVRDSLPVFSLSYEIVVRPRDLKSPSKERAGMFLSSLVINTWDRASTKDMVLSFA